MSLSRVRKITLPDGTAPFYLDGRVIPTALPQFTTLQGSKAILADGETIQRADPRQFSITFVARIFEETYEALRAFLDALMGESRDASGAILSRGALGLRNRRFYLYDDRYWIVRHEGTHLLFPYPGIRDQYFSMELYLRVLDPFLRDDAGNLYRSW